MLAVQGYFDGAVIQPLERISVKPNQRVIITIMDEMDEFVNPPEKPAQKKGMRGILARYANPALAEREQNAWECAAIEKSRFYRLCLMQLSFCERCKDCYI